MLVPTVRLVGFNWQSAMTNKINCPDNCLDITFFCLLNTSLKTSVINLQLYCLYSRCLKNRQPTEF